MTAHNQDADGYRLRRCYLIVGVICAICFAGMGVVSTVAAISNIDGSFRRPRLAAICFGTFWGGFTLLSSWMILAYFREKLSLEATTITQHGLIRNKSVSIGEVTQINWRLMPGPGSIVVRSGKDKLRIYLDIFTTDERRRIINYVRNTFPQNVQEGRLDLESLERRIRAYTPRSSNAAAVACSLVLFAFGVTFIYCWVANMGVHWLVFGAANLLAGFWYLWRIRVRSQKEMDNKPA